ncbi:hypothetical protein LINGRAHAP2_LOCUS11494 [Linum grandiflorum]
MCPMRLILVFFSAVLAGYFAWTTVTTASPSDDDSTIDKPDIKKQKEESNTTKVNCLFPSFALQAIQNWFWVFVDMASGRYLWRNLNEIKIQQQRVD